MAPYFLDEPIFSSDTTSLERLKPLSPSAKLCETRLLLFLPEPISTNNWLSDLTPNSLNTPFNCSFGYSLNCIPASCKLSSNKSLPRTRASLIFIFLSSFLISVIAFDEITKLSQPGLTVLFFPLIISIVCPLFKTVERGAIFLSTSQDKQ